MNTTACIELGIIQRKHGLKGEVLVVLHQEVSDLDTLKNLFIQVDHTLVPYGVEQLSWQHQRAIIKLRGVNDPTVAHDLKGRSIFVPQEALPRLSGPSMLLEKLIGYQVVDVKEGELGPVQDIYQPSHHQQLLAVDYGGEELLIPYHEDIVTQIDHSQQTIQVQLPKGFI